MTAASTIPIASTPTGGYGDPALDRYDRVMPDPVLAGCDEPLVDGAPDLRGTWRAVEVRTGGELATPGGDDMISRVWSHHERIEQAGSRAVVTGGGVVHDFFSCDGTEEHGLHDVLASDFATPLVVVGSYEDGALVMRPTEMPGVEVKRWREGDELVWEYSVFFTVRMRRVDAGAAR